MNHPNKEKLRIAAVGDLHPHEASYGRYLELFGKIAQHTDVLLLCGDLTNTGDPSEAMKLADGLRHISVPVLAVTGNHDHEMGKQAELKEILKRSGVIFIEDEPFRLGQVGFVGVKGFGGGFDQYMLGSFGEEAVKKFVDEAIKECLKLENALKVVETEKIVVALHYSPVAETVRGEHPEIYPFLGCSRLAEVVDRFNVEAVFHGHAHHGALRGQTKKGIPVYNCTFELMNKRNPDHPYASIEL
jgi:Icc-related predicted phosphoesterase